MTTILQLGDFHMGSHYLPEVGEAMIALAQGREPDAVVCVGDLVQWGDLTSEWDAARALFERLPAPRLAVPGNHDQPVFKVHERIVRPFAAFERHIQPEGAARIELPGAVVVGIRSAQAATLDLGYVTRRQLERARAALEAAEDGAVRIAVLHHGVRELSFRRLRNAAWGAARLADALKAIGVEVVMTGHNHYPHAERLEGPGEGLIWSQSGAACCDRFLHPTYRRCSVTEVRIEPDEVHVTFFGCPPGGERFEPEETRRFPRPASLR